MKKIITSICLLVTAIVTLNSCNDYETYAEKRDKENAAIAEFVKGNTLIAEYINGGSINVITESEFEQQGQTTDVSKNQFVLFETSGVYMQIVRKGCGSKLESGQTAKVLCRFDEYNILGDSLQLSNDNSSKSWYTDEMTVMNSYGTFTATFSNTVPNMSLMTAKYNSTSVPAGWLIPLRYVNIGRPQNENEEVAQVKIIVPSAQGQAEASGNTYPCFYVLSYEKNR